MRKIIGLVLTLVLVGASTASAQRIGAAQCEVLKKLEAKFGSLNAGSDDQRREFALKAAEQFAFSFPGQGYGSKRASNGRPPTKDVVARQLNGVFEGWDLVNGTTRKVTCDGTRYDLTGQVFIPVTAKNHLAAAPPPEEPPNPPPTGTCDLAPVLAAIAQLNARLDQMDMKVNLVIAQFGGTADSLRQQLEEIKTAAKAARPVEFTLWGQKVRGTVGAAQ